MLLWDVRKNMEANHVKKLEQIKNKYKDKESYYIHVVVNWTNNSMTHFKSTYLIRDKRPPKMLGSMLYFIDNKKGIDKLEWALPMDILVDSSLLDLSTSSESVALSARGIEGAIKLS